MTNTSTPVSRLLAAELTDIGGEPVFRVPLIGRGGTGKFALLDAEGLDALTWAGARALYLTGDGSGNAYVAFLRAPSHHAAMASRMIINAPQGRRVVYLNGDRMDLRTANLAVQPRKDENPFEMARRKATAIAQARQARARGSAR